VTVATTDARLLNVVHSQQHERSDFEWNDLVVTAVWEEAVKPLAKDGSDNLGFFKYLSLYGRPLFGSTFKPKNLVTYGYLKIEEAKALVSALQSLEPGQLAVADVNCDVLVDDLCDTLTRLTKKKYDIWIERS
jgi:hypothetical protein